MDPGSFTARLPFHMVWLATNLCNARCLHCSSNSAKCLPNELSTTEALTLVEEFADAGVVDMAVSGGEPLLRSDLFRIIEHGVRLGISVGVGTNGTTISQDVAVRLRESGVHRLQVSVDGLPPEHDKLRCWPGLYQRALRAVAIARNVGLRVHVCCTITRMNAQDLEEFAERISADTGVSRLNFSRYVPTGRGRDDLDLTEPEWRDVIYRCAQLRKHYKGRLEVVTHLAQSILVDDEVKPLPGFVGCQAGRGQGCVTADGAVFPCVLLPVSIGNVRECSFRKLWTESPIILELQRREGLKGVCGGCTWQARCGGCRAVAFARTGDYLSADPRCWLSN
jgi:radical SAM protein with 4Fe4S-binding SPASM domain